MTENKELEQLIVRFKENLATAEKQLVDARKRKADKKLLDLLTGNYTVAKNNLALLKGLAESKPIESVSDTVSPRSAVPSKRKKPAITVELHEEKKSATPEKQLLTFSDDPARTTSSRKSTTFQTNPASDDSASGVKMTRHEYREELKHHH